MNDSFIKSWFKRNYFKPIGWRSNSRNWFTNSHGRCCTKFGRIFRIRREDNWVVDISEPIHQFDRWANSTEHTVSLKCFMHNVQSGKFKQLLK